MKLFISSDQEGLELKDYLIQNLDGAYQLIDVTPENANFVASVQVLVEKLANDADALGIAVDAYGAGSFMAATKHKGMVAAEVSDERSAYMTREHNNSRIITLGSEIVGKTLAKNIVKYFADADYEGGRHQIRVDMLNKLC